jgi:methionyl-tRNA formyltransferase
MRIVFMGTPDFSVPGLRALATLPDVEIVGVITRRDQPVGRGRKLEAPPVKIAALDANLPIWQPGSLRKEEAQDLLRSLAPDVIIVAAFGQILPPSVLKLPPHGCINIHASLLPRYRGASPIANAILDGQPLTGNTIMMMDEGLDTGAIISQESIPIASDDTTATLTAKLATHGADLLVRTLPQWVAGKITPTPQDDSQATLTRLIRKEDGQIDWQLSADTIERRLRAYTPWPGIFTLWNGQPLKVIAAKVASPDTFPISTVESPGHVITSGRGSSLYVGVCCGAGSVLELDVIQLSGKRATPAPDVIRGQSILAQAVLPS